MPIVTRSVPVLTTLDQEPGAFWYGSWRDVNVAVWQRAATVDAVARIDRTVPGRMKAYPGRQSTVHISLESADSPTAEARAAFAASAKRWKDITGCVAVVIEQKGFLASALRSAVTGIQLISGTDFPLRAHASVAEAAPWLAQMHEQTANVRHAADDLQQALRAARAYCM